MTYKRLDAVSCILDETDRFVIGAHLETTQKYIPLVIDGLEAAMNGRSYHHAG